MTDNEFLLKDRLQKIRQIIGKYGEENFYISFSGGKDSTVLHYLVDEALPGNKIPRVYADTGIEFTMIRDFVCCLAGKDDRIVIIKPETPIKPMLEREGYPFKSKGHSEIVEHYQRRKEITIWVSHYLNGKWQSKRCHKILKYQFDPGFDRLKISDKCCLRMKEEPLHKWQRENNKAYAILGLMREEGGRRADAKCLAWKGKRFNFQPLVAVTKSWEDWYIEQRKINLCELYSHPYNFERTGCKGCPFNIHLQEELDTLNKYLPNEAKQCEIIWKPVYDEYRRIGYRLKKTVEHQVTVDEWLREREVSQTNG